MPPQTVQIVQPRLLTVEGREEELFFGAPIQYMGLPSLQIISLQGKDNYGWGLKALALSPSFSRVTALGVVRDADNDAGSAFQSVHDALKRANLPIPKRPLHPTNTKPRVTVMILLGGNLPGSLEDLRLRALVRIPPCPVWIDTLNAFNKHKRIILRLVICLRREHKYTWLLCLGPVFGLAKLLKRDICLGTTPLSTR